MLLTSVIILVREVLEAALIVSLQLAAVRQFNRGNRWLMVALFAGLSGAFVCMQMLGTISEWFDGVGQEVVNASMQILIFALLSCVNLALSWYAVRGDRLPSLVLICMAAGVAVAITREGSEVMVYISGFSTQAALLQPVLTGSGIGFGIGLSVGALTYFGLRALQQDRAMLLIQCALLLVASGQLSQAALLLTQADWLPAQMPAWDTSGWISESSVSGQLLYALLAYEATPTPIQAGLHAGSLLLGGLLVAATRWLGRPKSHSGKEA